MAEPLNIWKIGTKEERRAKVNAMLDSVGIDPHVAGGRYPREFSGGQCQRISIARALVLEPKLLVCDEIVSALDVSVQAQILNLLEDLKREHNLTLFFIAHDLAVVKNVSDRVAVMYLGRLCEIAPSDVLYAAPAHHYTEALLSSAVEPNPEVDAHAGHPGRRAAEPDQPPVGMPLPHPLPPGRGPLRRRGPRAARRSPPATRWPATSPSAPETARRPPRRRRLGRLSGPAARLAPAAQALAELGIEASTQVWTDPACRWDEFDLVLANGAWDNIHRPDEFLAWADRVAEVTTLVNAPAVLRWNLDKRYLAALADAGVPTVPTTWLTRARTTSRTCTNARPLAARG